VTDLNKLIDDYRRVGYPSGAIVNDNSAVFGLIDDYRRVGYPSFLAVSTACQDILIAKIAASSLKTNVTVKGGVLMHSMSGSERRATRDLDLDFMRYPLTEDAIDHFIAALNVIDDGVSISRVARSRNFPSMTTKASASA
jgi:hypothetical protein